MYQLVSSANLPTSFGHWKIHGFVDDVSKAEHIAISYGDIAKKEVLTRIHSECLTGDAFFSQKCDCGAQLKAAMQKIQENGSGVILYLRQEGRGIGIINKIKAYHLQDEGLDTVEANLALHLPEDARTYEMVEPMLKALQVQSIKLLTNNPAKINAMDLHNVEVVQRIPLKVGENEFNRAYLAVKAKKMQHLL